MGILPEVHVAEEMKGGDDEDDDKDGDDDDGGDDDGDVPSTATVEHHPDVKSKGDSLKDEKLKNMLKEMQRAPLRATSAYIGEPEDNEWWKGVQPHIMDDDTKHDDESVPQKRISAERKETNQTIYDKLRTGMGTFRFQNP